MENLMNTENIKEINERLDFIEFRQRLIFDDTEVSRLLFEYDITSLQYKLIMDLMDRYRASIGKKEKVYHGVFEDEIYSIVPKHEGNYHFCEYLTKAFMNEGKWEEVFKVLYGNMTKYQGV